MKILQQHETPHRSMWNHDFPPKSVKPWPIAFAGNGIHVYDTSTAQHQSFTVLEASEFCPVQHNFPTVELAIKFARKSNP